MGGPGDSLRGLVLDDPHHQVQPVEAGQGHAHGAGDGRNEGHDERQEGRHRKAGEVYAGSLTIKSGEGVLVPLIPKHAPIFP